MHFYLCKAATFYYIHPLANLCLEGTSPLPGCFAENCTTIQTKYQRKSRRIFQE
jgi:hypothetical protein